MNLEKNPLISAIIKTSKPQNSRLLEVLFCIFRSKIDIRELSTFVDVGFVTDFSVLSQNRARFRNKKPFHGRRMEKKIVQIILIIIFLTMYCVLITGLIHHK